MTSSKPLLINPNLFKTLRPLIKLSRIFGLCPITYKNSDKCLNLRIKWSWSLYILQLIAVTVITSWAIWGFIRDMQIAEFLNLGFTSAIDLYIAIFDVNEIIITGFIFVAIIPSTFKHLPEIIDNFNKIDDTNPQLPTNKIHRKILFLLSFVLVYMTVAYTCDLIMWSQDLLVGFIHDLPYYILYSVVVIHEVQYWFLVTLIRLRMSAMNGLVAETLNRNTDISSQEVCLLVETHSNILEAVSTVNRCFSGPTAIILLSCYLHLVVCPYILYVVASSDNGLFCNTVYFLWISVHFSRLLVIIEVCNNCENECHKTRNLIFKLLANTSKKGDVRRELKLFAYKNVGKKVRFSSYAVPKINRKLLISIATSISSYWMILYQFGASTTGL
ncbi:gustatory receptor 28 [Tribolium castaneum]|uniref:Gustatory receptor n=1 Tax=Tribolium castaneum TaxID=7070 RepID=D2A6B6_TRICA|nr:PREDICTED: uncharacterized protein LOC107398086 isoform X2 [Tribolium castaneum]EFA05761.1 gustatory receptor 28 [Tribolium castaneum]|eukprot:XP_015836470.1 PREDICTED: uncharacterized protein LOC107398086 isoform X2 [Tribolium castaneum]